MQGMALIDIQGVQLELAYIPAHMSAQAPASGTDLQPPRAEQRSPLVFLHEGLGSVAMWRDWPAAVCQATGRAGWVYSRRGYGQSDPTAEPLPPDYLHREAWAVLPALLAQLGTLGHPGLERPVLLGHSDGASIALLYASRFPVTACIALAPHVMVEEVSIQSITQARRAFEAEGLRERLALAISTCGVGLIPFAPGTFGALVGVVIFYALFTTSFQR